MHYVYEPPGIQVPVRLSYYLGVCRIHTYYAILHECIHIDCAMKQLKRLKSPIVWASLNHHKGEVTRPRLKLANHIRDINLRVISNAKSLGPGAIHMNTFNQIFGVYGEV